MGYCERCGGTYDFEGICETCGTDEEWSWNPPEHNHNKVKCKGCGTEIYEVRRYCHVCGKRNDAAFVKGKNYCPRCGIAFVDGVCPNCGRKLSDFLSRSIDPKQKTSCSSCRKETSSKDLYCIHCGNENYIKYAWQRPSPKFHSAGKSDSCVSAESSRQREEGSSNYTVADSENFVRSINTRLWTILGLIQAILFCMPTGIVTIIYCIHATNCAREGMMERAERKLKTAKTWFFAGVAIEIILIIAAVLFKIFI